MDTHSQPPTPCPPPAAAARRPVPLTALPPSDFWESLPSKDATALMSARSLLAQYSL